MSFRHLKIRAELQHLCRDNREVEGGYFRVNNQLVTVAKFYEYLQLDEHSSDVTVIILIIAGWNKIWFVDWKKFEKLIDTTQM